ncbi:MAG: tyrosine-type recombinase/integrase [bacterium]
MSINGVALSTFHNLPIIIGRGESSGYIVKRESVLRGWEDFCLFFKGNKMVSVKKKKNLINLFFNWLDEREIPIEKVGKAHIRDYFVWVGKSGKTPAHLQNLSKAVRSLFSYLNEYEINLFPYTAIKRYNIVQAIWRIPNQEEFERFRKEPDTSTFIGIRDRAMIEVLHATGMRIGELCKMEKDMINFDLYPAEITIMGKGDKVRTCLADKEAIYWLQLYLSKSKDKGKRVFTITEKAVRARFRLHSENSGVKINPHLLRHMFATNMLSNGGDLRLVQEHLGHASVKTTEIYTTVTASRKKEGYEKYHGFQKKPLQ